MERAMEKAAEIIRERAANGTYADQYCVLAQEDMDGRLTASVITPAKAEGIEWINFCTGLGGNKAKRALRDGRASVCFASSAYSIALRGRLEVITDARVKRENWYTGLESHFAGPDDPQYCVLRFHTETYTLFVDWEEVRGEV